jgi:hypothetical protein
LGPEGSPQIFCRRLPAEESGGGDVSQENQGSMLPLFPVNYSKFPHA